MYDVCAHPQRTQPVPVPPIGRGVAVPCCARGPRNAFLDSTGDLRLRTASLAAISSAQRSAPADADNGLRRWSGERAPRPTAHCRAININININCDRARGPRPNGLLSDHTPSARSSPGPGWPSPDRCAQPAVDRPAGHRPYAGHTGTHNPSQASSPTHGDRRHAACNSHFLTLHSESVRENCVRLPAACACHGNIFVMMILVPVLRIAGTPIADCRIVSVCNASPSQWRPQAHIRRPSCSR